MKRIVGIGIVAIFAASCSSTFKKSTIDPLPEGKVSEFDQGMKALEREDYVTASDTFEHLLVQKPATELDLVVLYNAGAAQEGLGNCAKAGDRYRQVVRSSAGKFQRIEGEALFRASLMYECTGEDTKAITALLDARKRGRELSFEVLGAEIPARLAAAYARIGNRDKALQYFNQASRGLKQLVSSSGRTEQRDRVSHTLFLMGRLSPSQRMAQSEPTTYLQSISMQQPYLLQAMEMATPIWSERAAEDLKLAYENIWKFRIDDIAKRRAFFTRSLQTMNELRKIRMPKDEDKRSEEVFAMLDQTQRQVQTELARVAESNPLTPEAERREGLKRQGRLVDPGAAIAPGKKKKATVQK